MTITKDRTDNTLTRENLLCIQIGPALRLSSGWYHTVCPTLKANMWKGSDQLPCVVEERESNNET